MSTEWIQIQGYSRYSVSNDGRVRNDRTNKLLAHNLNSSGYKRVSIYSDNARKYKQCTIHRLIAVAFIENTDSKDCVDHIDNNKVNNVASNLQWVTKAENTQMMYNDNLSTQKKLSDSDKDTIVKLMDNAERGARKRVAQRFNVDPARVRQVLIERNVYK